MSVSHSGWLTRIHYQLRYTCSLNSFATHASPLAAHFFYLGIMLLSFYIVDRRTVVRPVAEKQCHETSFSQLTYLVLLILQSR